ncbi:MAG TPA: hypothetical protein VI541_00615 [Actinomycetota bacterium]|nr:hypothetical protein [Actinomycetota bacterium]
MTETAPSFSTAVERAYLKELRSREAASSFADASARSPLLTVHEEILAVAIYQADPNGGGLALKRLPNKQELEERLLEALRRSALTDQ